MSERRMFSREVVESDSFLDLPLSAQALYLHICMEADDDGFVNNANRIKRVVGAADNDMGDLLDAEYILKLDSGNVVVTHWKIMNTIRKDRYKQTVYQSDFKQLGFIDGKYTMDSTVNDTPIQSIPNERADVKFEEFWKAYPRKEHKSLAMQQFANQLIHGIKADDLIASAKKYAKDKKDTDSKYLNCPDTWLEKGLYADYEVKENTVEKEPEPIPEEPPIDLWSEGDGE